MKQVHRRSNLEPGKFVSELNQIISERQKQYENALVRLAIRRENGELKISFGRIDFLFKDDKVPNEITFDYNNFILTRFVKKSDEIPDFLKKLMQGETVKINSEMNVQCEFEKQVHWDNEELPSGKEYVYIKNEFPSLHYSSRLDNHSIDSRLILAGKNLRPYPNASYAIIDFMDLHLSNSYGKYLNESKFIVLAPDFSVRIKRMKIMRNKIRIELDCKQVNENDIISQFYIDGDTNNEVPIVNQSSEIESSKEPDDILAVILDKKSGEILDYKKYEFHPSETDSSIQKEDPEDVVKEWINRGENDFIEFKEGLKHADDVMKTIVAFANTKGGVIIMGIKDDGSMIGTDESADSVKNRLERMISSKCDPPIDFSVKRIEFDDKGITYIKIPKGSSKLYSVTNGPIYVRRGASDIFIKPSEIVEMFTNSRSSSMLGL